MNFINDTRKSDLKIYIVDNGIHNDWWNRFKTRVWNFILPPHLRLEIIEEDGKR